MKFKKLSPILIILILSYFQNALAANGNSSSYVQVSNDPCYNCTKHTWLVRLVCADPAGPITSSFPGGTFPPNGITLTDNTIKFEGDMINAPCNMHDLTVQGYNENGTFVQCSPTIKNLDTTKFYAIGFQFNNNNTCNQY